MDNIKTGITIFAYNRPSHLRRVLIALEDYKIKDVNVYIDGPKNNTDKKKKKEILFMLQKNQKIKFKIHKSRKNKGLGKSLIDGITLMSKNYDQTIVLEDDCIPRVEFFPFITKCLKEFRAEKKVLAICGYQLPELHEENNKNIDTVILKNFMSWGWAIWSDRWMEFAKKKYSNDKKENDSKIWISLKSIKKNNKKLWTPEFIKFSKNNEKVFVFPNKSLVKNIGFDGTGVNSKSTFKFNTSYTKSKKIRVIKDLKIDRAKNLIQEKIILKRFNLFY